MQTTALRRIQTTPYGSESTSAYWYENINNCAYWISVIQHPYGESDQNRIKELPSTGTMRACKQSTVSSLHASMSFGHSIPHVCMLQLLPPCSYHC